MSVSVLLAACSNAGSTSPTVSTGGEREKPHSEPARVAATTTGEAITVVPTTVQPPTYVFPFVGKPVSYGTTHHDYPASDVFGCGAIVVAPTDGIVVQTREVDLWDAAIDLPSNRGGKYVSLLGRDGVRYYFAHLETVLAVVGQAVQPGDPMGVMGRTGNARESACHTHFGISWPCPQNEWRVRRGEVWPAPYLDAWRAGEQRSPVLEVFAVAQENPTACDDALAEPSAAAA